MEEMPPLASSICLTQMTISTILNAPDGAIKRWLCLFFNENQYDIFQRKECTAMVWILPSRDRNRKMS